MSIEDLEYEIQNNDALLVYFSGENCGVCQALQPKIKNSFEKSFPKIKQLYISANDFPQTAAHFSIFTVPSIIIFFDKKETKRESRHISVDNLIHSTQRVYDIFFN
ncbi:MAG: thioredoxin family protein [Arcobacteraceae bacterium]|jgi:thioredoxin-like negative regulator of GroEL